MTNPDAAWHDLCAAKEREYLTARDLVECPVCHGSGERHINRSRGKEPWWDETYACWRCDGDGVLEPG